MRGVFIGVSEAESPSPPDQLTTSGNSRDMFKYVVAAGVDGYALGGKTSGSVLIERMKIAGS